MTISISNAVPSTWIILVAFLAALVFWHRRKEETGALSREVTGELKGVAILAVVFAHVGYYLVSDHRFLFPLSIMAGTAVNLFLFLSGYGLTSARLKRDETRLDFYRRKLLGLAMPLWIVLAAFLLADFFILHISYPFAYAAKAFLGIFTNANLYQDLNSPLWYMTPIIFYYVLFPLVFSKRHPWLTAVFLFLIPAAIVRLQPAALLGVIGLYEVHLFAFPLGVLCAAVFSDSGSRAAEALRLGSARVRAFNARMKGVPYYALVALLMAGIAYGAVHSGVGSRPAIEQAISLAVMGLAILLFMIKRTQFGVLSLLGLYSYEIYLLHWPILYRYDQLFGRLPPWLALLAYLALFVGLGRLLRGSSDALAQAAAGRKR